MPGYLRYVVDDPHGARRADRFKAQSIRLAHSGAVRAWSAYANCGDLVFVTLSPSRGSDYWNRRPEFVYAISDLD